VEKATKGPIHWWKCGTEWCLATVRDGKKIVLQPVRQGNGASFRVRNLERCLMEPFDPTHPDAAVIVAAVNALPLLLEVVKVSRKFNESCICHLAQGCAACELKAALARLDEGVRHG
jgi:hypothetical protein